MSTSKTLTDLFAMKQSVKIKNTCRYCLQCFNCEKVLTEHKEVYLKNKWQTNCKVKKWFN